ncbi:VOC family protein [Nocardioides seonyuensis]|uniref:VOC family protein n=1 Tax=Nocardioides seonyuensis TaxID=2518371 RepID=A0A4P7IHT9_9ACTN|nr:VOC family protein [Nocardioides seonyuensis]QBX56959.1 VOC family protein [Nocardioides seonyuensis]
MSSSSGGPSWVQVFLDTPAEHFEEALSFWSSVTGWRPSQRRGENGQFLTLLPSGGAAYVKMQAVSERAGVHLDLDSDDRPASIIRARELGATPAWTYHDVEVMRSPGGMVFCQTLGAGESAIARGAATILDQVCLDVPSSLWESEVVFWTELTGREAEMGVRPEFVRLPHPTQARILLQRLEEPRGTVSAHPDMATTDRHGVATLHVRLGARVVEVRDRWTVLTAPGGQVYCLTDRDPSTG